MRPQDHHFTPFMRQGSANSAHGRHRGLNLMIGTNMAPIFEIYLRGDSEPPDVFGIFCSRLLGYV